MQIQDNQSNLTLKSKLKAPLEVLIFHILLYHMINQVQEKLKILIQHMVILYMVIIGIIDKTIIKLKLMNNWYQNILNPQKNLQNNIFIMKLQNIKVIIINTLKFKEVNLLQLKKELFINIIKLENMNNQNVVVNQKIKINMKLNIITKIVIITIINIILYKMIHKFSKITTILLDRKQDNQNLHLNLKLQELLEMVKQFLKKEQIQNTTIPMKPTQEQLQQKVNLKYILKLDIQNQQSVLILKKKFIINMLKRIIVEVKLMKTMQYVKYFDFFYKKIQFQQIVNQQNKLKLFKKTFFFFIFYNFQITQIIFINLFYYYLVTIYQIYFYYLDLVFLINQSIVDQFQNYNYNNRNQFQIKQKIYNISIIQQNIISNLCLQKMIFIQIQFLNKLNYYVRHNYF